MKQGGSTLTQQLVKNLYLSPERTLRRKAIEAVMAVVLDARYSKDEILEAYLNEIYLGRRGSIAITGVGEAARYYFGKEVSDLDLAESATLAGMIRAPNAYSPFRNPERTRERRDLVLRLMLEEGKIDEAALRARGGGAAHAPDAQRRAHQGAPLRRLRQERAHGALRREAADRGPPDLHDARRRSAAGGAARRDAGARDPREDLPAPGLGGASRRRSRARSSPLEPQTGASGRSSAGGTTGSRSSTA